MEKLKEPGAKEKKRVFTVSELTRLVRAALEGNFPDVWVEGEISNYTKHTSGHIYFSLKDEGAVLSCVLFRSAAQKLKFKMESGMHVICRGRIGLYEKRGQYQLYAELVEPKGIGALQMAFEQLKRKLQIEGLFDESRKRSIPYLPSRIGVVTSPTGAAIRDILNVTKRRFQNIEVILNPVRVQGERAGEEIARAIADFNEFAKGARPEEKIDVLIVGRGGGSLEDLWAFNEEVVARAIFASEIPVISAVGHEVDWTIADFVADKRAPTPSAAAELVIPRKEELLTKLDQISDRLDGALINKIKYLRDALKALSESYILRQPVNLIEQYQQRIDDIARNIEMATLHILDLKQAAFSALGGKIELMGGHILDLKQAAFSTLSGKLDMLSPFNVLSRGYSITTDSASGKVLKDTGTLEVGARVRTRLNKGSFISVVKRKEKKGGKEEL